MSVSQAAQQPEELLHQGQQWLLVLLEAQQVAHQGQQRLLVLLEAQQGAPVVLEVQQVPLLRPQELLLGRSAL